MQAAKRTFCGFYGFKILYNSIPFVLVVLEDSRESSPDVATGFFQFKDLDGIPQEFKTKMAAIEVCLLC